MKSVVWVLLCCCMLAIPSVVYPMMATKGGPSAEPDRVVVFDVWNYFDSAGINDVRQQADIFYALTSLQGIVNRERPRLYLLAALSLFDLESKYRGTSVVETVPVTDLDAFWLEWIQQKGWIRSDSIVRLNTLEDVFSCYESEIKGLVLWDVSVGATLNAALMAAGAEDWLPVSDRLADGTLGVWLKEKFPALQVKLDLSGAFQGGASTVSLDGIEFKSCGSAKNDVYRFVIERFLKSEQLSADWMWYNCDGYIWGAPERWKTAAYGRELYARLGNRAQFQNNGLYNADFWVSKRAVFVDLYPWGDSAPSDDPNQRVGEDLKTWNDILQISYEQRDGRFGVAGGFISWWIKYTKAQGNPHDAVPGEWQFVQLLTSYNMLNDADAAFGIANASFFQHMPKIAQAGCKWEYPPLRKLEPGTTYIAFMMMDYDGSAWLNQSAVSIYRDPARGKIPLNWCINPILNFRVPHAFQYMAENRTKLDFFGIESDGTGYLSPYYLQAGKRAGRVQTDALRAYENFSEKLRERYGINYNAFYITSAVDDPWLEMCARLNPEGFGVHVSNPPLSVDGAPVVFLKPFSVADVVGGRFAGALEKVYRQASDGRAANHFEPLRCILLTPTQITTVVEEMEKKYPDAKVKIVDWPNFLHLRKQWLSLKGKNDDR
ncbi:MAG: hypothetical protein K9M45_10615 [Kiritimatiellales bacterium]|nr:hypothetical protein [Kiritimatiellales bacterium]